MSYRRRLERDLDEWIARGLVPADSRAPILDSVGEARRVDASTALAVIGAFLAGVAVIAFVAANWSVIPRIGRFALILAAFLAAAGGAAWASARGRPVTTHVLLSVAALVFAAAIGLTGQIFDIGGDPQTALRSAGLAAALLALAGRSPWTAAVALVLLAFGDFADSGFGPDAQAWPGWMVVAAPLAAGAALAGRSQALAHAAGLAGVLAVITVNRSPAIDLQLVMLAGAAVLAAGAAGARAVRLRFEGAASALYGWWTWGALFWFGGSGFGEPLRGLTHSIAWLALAIAVVVLGRHDRHALITAAGVVGLFAAGMSLLFNLGVGLMTSAAIFGGLAVVALGVALGLKRVRAA